MRVMAKMAHRVTQFDTPAFRAKRQYSHRYRAAKKRRNGTSEKRRLAKGAI